MKGQQEYVVEAIRDVRFVTLRGGKPSKQYLVKWEGYPEEVNTWEPEQNLGNCERVMQQFNNKRKIEERERAKKKSKKIKVDDEKEKEISKKKSKEIKDEEESEDEQDEEKSIQRLTSHRINPESVRKINNLND
jgi:hypothetical protein